MDKIITHSNINVINRQKTVYKVIRGVKKEDRGANFIKKHANFYIIIKRLFK